MSRFQEECKLKRVDVVLELTNTEMDIFQAIEDKNWDLVRKGSLVLLRVFVVFFAFILLYRLETIKKAR